ncbi:unnamed protein product [Acanthoscelides obtectus]|uniref:PiggyBac transposable element-derived protein 4 C-terminal zinc-finger domain-containing protein n=1 Tax=Acanthoscelides obtectus TaxID=200917 RepID=A0A9P0PC49_ACAOB|nr:unnamed protein product [Acanthoscelides obtectus]CAK1669261.1 PiggyBac transposable element-derived protein 4 [Acanthoscelides obtectus]
MDICLLNAHAMYLTQNPAKVPLATFQLAVIRQLLERFQKTASRSVHLDLGNKRLTQRHFPDLVTVKEGIKSAYRRCYVCSHSKQKPKKRKETKYMCRECDVGLCPAPCFKIYHEENHF